MFLLPVPFGYLDASCSDLGTVPVLKIQQILPADYDRYINNITSTKIIHISCFIYTEVMRANLLRLFM